MTGKPKAFRDPAHRAEVRKQQDAFAAEVFGRGVTVDEVYEAAHRLGLADHLPDPQQVLPLDSGA